MNDVQRHSEPSAAARRIIDLLVTAGPMTVAELVEALGVTTTAVRQQTTRLILEGWLVRIKRRGGPGRPADVLSVSAQASQLFGQRADELSKLLIEEIFATEGSERAIEVLRGVSKRIASSQQQMVGHGSLSERLRGLAGVLTKQGLLVEPDAEHRRLTVFTCPYSELAVEHREVCEMEREVFSELIGSPMKLEQCMLDGSSCCDFYVTEQVTKAESV